MTDPSEGRLPLTVLHVEVGGSYGGSLRALEAYLSYSDRDRFTHEALLYYPTPGSEALGARVRRLQTLEDPTAWSRRLAPRAGSSLRLRLRDSPMGPLALSIDRWLRIATDARLARRLKPLIEATRCDVVHVNNTFTYQAATLVAGRQLRLPVISHARNPIDSSLLTRHLLRFSDAVATVNRGLERTLMKWHPSVVVRTCYDGVEMPRPAAGATTALRRSLAGHDGQLIGSVGRLDSQKGYHDLVKAAQRVVNENPWVRFAIAGEGPSRDSLERLIRRLNLSGHVLLLGFQADIPSFLDALDIFVSSSVWEGLPIALVEAMLLAKPVVATDVGGCGELVTPGEAGVLVPASQPEQLADALLRQLAKKPSESLREASRQRARSLTDPQASARRLDELFLDVWSRRT